MATRYVKTRLVIDGEAEYKASVASLNAELKKHQSALDLVKSQYQNNANSIEALQAKQKALADIQDTQTRNVKELEAAYKNAQAATDTYAQKKEELTQQIKDNEQALEDLKKQEGDTTAEQQKLTQETDKLKKELADNDANLNKAQKSTDNWESSLNKAKIGLNNTNAEIQKNDRYMDEAKNSTDQCATSIDRYGKEVKEAGQKAETAGNQSKQFGDKSTQAVDTLSAALAAAGIVVALEKIKDSLMACVDASIEFESAITGVAKTTNLSERELADMSDSIKEMSGEIPLATTELAQIAETAGQLGVSGAKNILEFTQTMAKLGTATNLTSDEAATMLAQFANITAMPVEDYEKLGSSIVALGNSTATTESKIVDISQGIAATATLAGISEPEIVALAAAVTSLGIETDAGATSMSKLISEINTAVETGDGLNEWASVAGMSADNFAKAWRENAAGALNTFIQGLNNTEQNGRSATVVLSDLGITETRLTRMTLSLAGSGDLLTNALDTSNQAFEENTALAKEAATRYQTTESKIQLLKNAFNNVKIAVGDQLNPAIETFVELGTDASEWAEDFIEQNEWLVPTITALATGLGVLGGALLVYTVAVKAAEAIQKAWNAAMNANPAFLVVSAIAALVSAITVLIASYDGSEQAARNMTTATREAASSLDEIKTKFNDTRDSNEAAAIMADQYIGMLRDLEPELDNSTTAQTRYKLIVDKLNQVMPNLNATINEQTHAVQGGVDALEDSVDALKDYYKQQAYMEKYGDILAGQADLIIDIEEAEIALKEAREDRDKMTRQAGESEEDYSIRVAFTEARLRDLELAIDDGKTQLAEYNIENKSTLEILQNLSLSLDDYVQATQGMTNEQKAAYDTTLTLESELANLQTAYDEAYNKALDTLNSQVGMFDNLSIQVTTSSEDMINAWDSQINYYDTYSKNLRKLSEYGISDGLVKAWSDGSVESAGYIQAIVNEIEGMTGSEDEKAQKTKEFVDGFNAKYAESSQAKDDFAKTLAGMQTDFQESMDEINRKLQETVDNMNKTEDAAKNAAQTGQGYANGLYSKMDDVYKAGKALAMRANAGWTDFYIQRSPARKAIETAEQTADSYIMGLENKIHESEMAGYRLAEASREGYVSAPTKNATGERTAHITINTQTMTDAQIRRLVNIIDAEFGR